MNDCLIRRPAIAAKTDVARLPDIVRILTTREDARRRFDIPESFAQRERMLYAAHPACFAAPTEQIEALSERHELDVVCAAYDPDPLAVPLVFKVGVRLFWKVLWHEGFRLWRPDDAGLACFVPIDPAVRMHFVIDGGRLHAWEGQPYRDVDDRALGLAQADAAVRAMLTRGR